MMHQRDYRQIGLKQLRDDIKSGKARTCEDLDITEDYKAAGVVTRVASLDGRERNFSFYLAERYPEDQNRPTMIRARLTNRNSTTGGTESALRASSELNRPIRVRGYLEREADDSLLFIAEELIFENQTFMHHGARQFCPVEKA